MARYGDLERLEQHFYNCADECRNTCDEWGAKCFEMAMKATKNHPTADVVPKSEVEVLKETLDATIAGQETLQKALVNAKVEVAREIFEDIEKKLSSMKYNANTPRKTVKVEELKEQVNWVLHEVVPSTIAELKKEYTQNCTTCKHMVSCEPNPFGSCDEYTEDTQ